MTFPVTAPEAQSPMPNETSFPSPAAGYRFARPGHRPISFSGSLLAMSMSFTPEIPYWYELNIFRTDRQSFVLVLKLFFQSEEEEDYTKAWEFDTLAEVFDALEGYDAAEDIKVKIPDFDSLCPAELAVYAAQFQAQIEARRSHWASLVGELLSELDTAA